MFYIQSSEALQILKNSLRKHLPESLKVYGTVFHMNQGNPFKLKAVVDKWPDFNTVVIRPQEQDMTDDLDHYNNTYLIYSKDPKHCQEFLGSSDVINWKQHLQIQSSQADLGKVIENLGATNLGKVKHKQCFLYMVSHTAKKLTPSLVDAKHLVVSSEKPTPFDHQLFKFARLDVKHAALVNSIWYFGGNEKSQKFIERCIFTFPSVCIMGPEGTPVSWALMDHTGELRMAGTLPKYRHQNLIYHVAFHQVHTLEKLGFPMYLHVDKVNLTIQRMSAVLGHVPMPCTWNQWNWVPL
ncbi:rCG47722 [Rattus norvegicus]|uniref:Glycine N-acyltransferase-like protein Keg1 n=3 Tax=Rattus norvegicus TaxID=10116 RepID=KEG1_RAT|nr:glycine N-acyltransferase-like protein Keg1 [Rattus norvegicus]Q9Z2Y0.2 RecName: Full=Glycine N-acyltransferase-like protein Keg1; AltName: Full=Acyl-CoA:glycine N-acyltransferase protein Keg1; AltName: Full=Hepatocellular carcinoma-enriched protein of 33 kDa; Short=HP33; AltName: Full=Kidney-expressed gene 1 protein [Rattus norvegicus]AAH78701.1 Kidney expressed gene 1 [Rattus norvegicus]EDM12927.1 rCG47722 [Rattus norvegicus]|eukprot:NP_599157.2 glycine N-acyltransferase-like protein Keg1 [Rattus norvegicus]